MKNPPSKQRALIVLAINIGLLVLVTGCHESATAHDSAKESTAAQLAAEVKVVSPSRQTITRVIRQPGYLKPYEQTPIYTKIAGLVQEVNVDIGDPIKKGQLLAVLWEPEMERELQARQARIKQTKAEVQQAKKGVEAAQATVLTSEAKIKETEAGLQRSIAEQKRWEAEYERGSNLLAKGIYDQQTLDEAQNQFKASTAAVQETQAKIASAKASLIESNARLAKAQADVAAAEAKVEVAEADYKQWSDWLDYRNIRAPYDGIVTQRNIHTGYFVQPSISTGKAADPLFIVMRTDIMRVNVQVPETDEALVKEGMPAVVRPQALPGKEFDGTVTRYTWSLDEQARTLRVEIHLKNDKDELRPGMYGDVTINTELPDVMALPVETLLLEGDQYSCFVVENDKAIKTLLRIGVRNDHWAQALAKQVPSTVPGQAAIWEPMTGKEQVVSSNPGALLDQQAVQVKQ
jgi:HlyD family secretion protein